MASTWMRLAEEYLRLAETSSGPRRADHLEAARTVASVAAAEALTRLANDLCVLDNPIVEEMESGS